MADTKLSDLTELAATPAADDEFYIRDVSEVAADESKRITFTNLLKNTAMARVYLGTDQANIENGVLVRIQFDTETADPGSNFSVAVWYDEVQADADSDATHIEDDDASFPTYGLNRALVTWASDSPPTANTGTGYVTAVDSDTLTINKASGDDFGASYYYTIYHSEYTVPVDGYYLVSANVTYKTGTVVADKEYRAWIYDNDTYIVGYVNHSSLTERLSCAPITLWHFDASDLITVVAYQNQGTNATLEGGSHLNNLNIFLVQAD